jgi:Rps23 Pro-64 3,4-dihydroxylase Tpa1-like proline 4-hydroxylase
MGLGGGKRPGTKAASSAASKRQATALGSPLAPKVLGADHVKKIKSEFKSTAGKPYSHCIIDGLCSEDRLRAVHDELVNNLSANLKESDLFKVYQTCDLANLGRNGVLVELAEKMPQLIALRDSLYSDEFKAMIQEVTGCGELGDHVDCATNLHTTGCHLLCHDDVIGTRKVSFIIYLTSPDEEWTAQDGGALEIYPSVSEGTPDIVPLKTVLPLFNTMVSGVSCGASKCKGPL